MASSPVPAPPDVVQRSKDDRQIPATVFRRWTTPLGITAFFAALKLLLQLAAISGYGYHRDELYHLAEAEHLSWGYVELPPLIAFLTRLIRFALGESQFAIRIVPAISGVLLVLLTGAFVRRFGGGRFATALACLAVTICPIFLAWNHFLSPVSFEPLFWMGCAYIMVRIIDGASPRLWLLFGVLAGLGIENKHTILAFGFAMALAMLFTSERRHFTQPWLWLGGLIALLLFLPNLIWEVQHGWPTLEFIFARRHSGLTPVPSWRQFFIPQILSMQPVTVLVWPVGLLWLLFSPAGKRYRVLGLSYVIAFLVFFLLKAKYFYLAPAYPMLLAAGAAARERFIERRPRRAWMRWEAMVVLSVGGLLPLPLVLPLLPIHTYVYVTRALHLPHEIPTESSRQGVLVGYYADMLPWESMTTTVAQVFHRLLPEEQSRTGILTADFGEAAAIDFFGRRYGLPKAMSGNLSYWLWGPQGFSGDTLILVGENIHVAAANCRHLEKAADFYHPYAMPYENGPMYLCRGLKEPLPVLWPRLKNWGGVY